MQQNVLHPWHGVHYGENAPRVVNAVIEIPQGSRCKYEIDKATGLLKLDRVIFSSFYYPINYGFIPQSYGGDKDPLDILVITSLSVQPLTLMDAKVIGVMQMIDGGETVEEAAGLFLSILKGEGTPAQQSAVVANAGMALFCCNQKLPMSDALAMAKEALQSGKAYESFKKLMNQ